MYCTDWGSISSTQIIYSSGSISEKHICSIRIWMGWFFLLYKILYILCMVYMRHIYSLQHNNIQHTYIKYKPDLACFYISTKKQKML